MGVKGFRFSCFIALAALMGTESLLAQTPFPAGENGVNYFSTRIDLLGAPLEINLDGELDDEAWVRAVYDVPQETWKGGLNASVSASEEDFLPSWASVADENFLYVSWKIQDDVLQTTEAGCAAFHDDAIEMYIDFGNEKEANSYDDNSIQADVPASTILGSGNPAELVTGIFKRGGCTGDQIVNTETNELLIQGVATELAGDVSGWQGELAIALQSTSDVGTWNIIPDHGVTIGIDVHFTDDDLGVNQGAQTKAQIWSLNDPNSQAWGNPQVFAELTFIEPGRALPGQPPALISDAVGENGVLYQAVRIDTIPASQGGSQTINLDGELDEQVWLDAARHEPLETWKGGQNASVSASFEDFTPDWSAAADENFLYASWRIVDDVLQTTEAGCRAFHDDSIEFYIDFGNEKEANSYDANSIQADVPASTILGSGNPLELVTGIFKRGGCTGDQIVNTETNELVIQGVATELAGEFSGWQGEIAIALQSTSDVGEWNIIPDDGVRIGIDVHFNDDDAGVNQGGQTKAQIWSLNDPNSQAWGNPQVFAELEFVELGVGPINRGDCNGDGGIDLSDGVSMLNFAFGGAAAPPCLASCDFNKSGQLDITTAIYFFGALFQGGSPIAAPTGSPAVSKANSDRALGCVEVQG